MDTTSLKATDNPTLANELVAQAIADSTQDEPQEVVIELPSDTLVDLPGGYITTDGEVYQTAEVRELNGRDEEALAKAATLGRMLNLALSRGVVSIGGKPANETMLEGILSGDRDALLLGIYKVTFGNPAKMAAYCSGCSEYKDIEVDLNTDIKTRILANPKEDREFTVQGLKHVYTVLLPSGGVQKEMNNLEDANIPELSSILLKGTVIAIDGSPVYSPEQVQSIGIRDRRKISEEIASRNPGPKFEDITVVCPDCESEVVVPISIGALFQLS